MDEPIDFEAFLHDRLAEIDGELAANKLEINLRPLRAAFSFVQQHILAVTEGTERHDIEEGYNYLAENWFALLYKDVETWFRNRYGAALDRSSKRTATGLVILWNTAFQLEVPLFRSKVETPGKTAWFSIPNTVLPDENPLLWLVAPPILSSLSATESQRALESTREIAGALRSINSAVMGTMRQHDVQDGMILGIRNYVEAAAQKIVNDTRPAVSLACWDLRMACECSVKAVLHRKDGKFPHTHDLIILRQVL